MDQVEHELVSPTGIHAGDTLTDAVDLLPTPSASRFNDGEDPETWQARHDFHASKAEGATRAGKPLAIAAVELLPTPTVGNVQGGNKTRSGDRSGELLLPGAALSMLPTPRASRGASGTETLYGLGGERTDDHRTQGQVVLSGDIDFRKYTAAVRRAEQIIGRPAPAPAVPDGKGGAYRLHSRFVEWMMMLPEGWVTGHGIGRNPELARLGNGVVPLQAAYAVRELVMRAAATR
jgi:DNA (cytosine-5)-methyltransferase 1